MSYVIEPSYAVLRGLVGRRVQVVPCAADGARLVPLTVTSVSGAVECGEWVTFTARLTATTPGRLTAPGRYHVRDGEARYTMTLARVGRERRGVHYMATFVHPVGELDVATPA